MLSIRCSYAISREIQADPSSVTIVLSFYHSTTYFLCCASSYLELHHSCQPFTIFTYADSETAKKSMNSDNSSMIASRLFQRIGYFVISPSATTTLDKEYAFFFFFFTVAAQQRKNEAVVW